MDRQHASQKLSTDAVIQRESPGCAVFAYFLSVKEPVACWPATSAGLRSLCLPTWFLSSAERCASDELFLESTGSMGCTLA
jgi:hypothetical protein